MFFYPNNTSRCVRIAYTKHKNFVRNIDRVAIKVLEAGLFPPYLVKYLQRGARPVGQIARLIEAKGRGNMVKRDTSFVLLSWLGRSAGIVLLLCEPVLVAGLLWSWTSSTPLERFSLLFFIVWGLPLAFSMLRIPRQRLRVESLRMRMKEAPLFERQPAYDEANLPVPATLTFKLSQGAYLVFTTFWLITLGIVLAFQTPYFLAWHIFWWVIGAWIALGGLILGLCSIAFYQRIEVTEESLMVQHGWRRRAIPWKEARLFAILSFDEKKASPHSATIINPRERRTPSATQYELSGPRTILRWTHGAPGPGFLLHPRDREEYKRLLEELRAYIRIKTGLMLLDLR